MLIVPEASEMILLRDVPARNDMFIDRVTGMPMRWMLQLELMDDARPENLYVWRSDAPRRVFNMAPNQTGPVRPCVHNYPGINPVTGLPNTWEFRDLALTLAGIR